MSSAAGGYFSQGWWSKILLDGQISPTTATPVQGLPPAGPAAACQRIGAFRNESFVVVDASQASQFRVGLQSGWNVSGPPCDAAAKLCGGAWCYSPPPPPIWSWPKQPSGSKGDVFASPPAPTPASCNALPTPWPKYAVTQRRANSGKPLINSQNPKGSFGSSTFHFNLVPSYLKLPDGSDALLTRSVNSSNCYANTMQCSADGGGEGHKCNGGHACGSDGASSAINPDYITLTKYAGGRLQDPDHANLEPITDASISLAPNRSKGSPEE